MPELRGNPTNGAHQVSEEDRDVRIRSVEVIPDGGYIDRVKKLGGDGRFAPAWSGADKACAQYKVVSKSLD